MGPYDAPTQVPSTEDELIVEHLDPMPKEPLTELGYAKRLVQKYGDRMMYVSAWRKWHVFDGTRWVPDDSGQVPRWAKVIARNLTTKAIKEEDKPAISSTLRAETAKCIAAAMTLASTEQHIAVSHKELNQDPFLLNCTNGTLDLRTGKLRAANPADLITKITGVDYNSDATGPAFEKFLAEVQPAEEMRVYLARLLGHSLEGRVVEHVLPLMCGDGANGKGTLINVVLTALGDYADAADPELLTARTFDAHPTGTADLFGRRLAVLHEGEQGRRLAEGLVKRLTGGDRVKARRMREDFWSFEPSHTFVMLSNHVPIITGVDGGIWRRLQVVPWPVVIPEDQRDEYLGDRLALEADAVLAWLVAGYQDWHNGGLRPPKTVTAATAKFRADSDAVGRFLDAECTTGDVFRAQSSVLFGAWERWCLGQGEEPGSQKAFSSTLENRGFSKKHTNAGAIWSGLTTRASLTDRDGS